MNTNTQALLVLAEQGVYIKVAVKKEWYIELLERLWRDEITEAISEAKRRRPRCAAEAHADLIPSP